MVCCFTLTGEKLWEFRDENVLRKPKGIALDKNRNVYVAGMESDNVVVLSSEGKYRRQVLSKFDGLNEPYSLRINIDRNELLVCNANGPAFLFSLQYM
jgi:DNA-binding beta-propeller fold protein YncE